MKWDKLVVCGHYEVAMPVITPFRICLDTAAYRTGILSALEMSTRTLLTVTRAEQAAEH